jgi:hypothetical protein
MASHFFSALIQNFHADKHRPGIIPPANRPDRVISRGRVVHSRAKDADAAIEKASTLLKIDPERLMAVRIAEKD